MKIFKPSLIILLMLFCGLTTKHLSAEPEHIFLIIEQTSQKYQVDEKLIYFIIKVESDFDHYAVSHCNARGLMQITQPTWEWICEQYLQVEWDFDKCAFEPEKNIEVGVRFLRWIIDYLDSYETELQESTQDLILACYNAGPTAVKDYGFRIPPFTETQNYVKKIASLRDNI